MPTIKYLPLYWLTVLLVPLVLFVTGCDAHSPNAEADVAGSATPEVCSETWGNDKADFFPLNVGNIWTFDYTYGSYGGGFSPDERTTGELVWEVTQSVCQEGRGAYNVDAMVYHIKETFSGKKAYKAYDDSTGRARWVERGPVSWSRDLQFVQKDCLSVPWMPRSFARFRSEVQDTVTLEQPEDAGLFDDTYTLRLVRNRGPQLYTFGSGASMSPGSATLSNTIHLRDVSLADH